MASIAPPSFPSPSTRTDPNPHKLNFSNSIFSASSRLKRASSNFNSHHHPLSRVSRSGSVLSRCNNSGILDNPSDGDESHDSLVRGWDSAIQDVFRKTMKSFDDYVNSFWNQDKRVGSEVKGGIDNGGVELENWDWERWRKHFSDVDEQERIVSVLKSQLASAISREDYEDAARLKVAIAASATNDTIAKALSHLNRAVQEERYGDAALLRDYAGAGLVGWWAGISEDTHDPYGCIIHISAEHGRYVARSYSPRQLATAKDGAPLFEIFFTMNKKGEYKQQAVYLKRRKAPLDFPIPSFKTSTGTSNFDSLSSTEDRSDLLEENAEDSTDSDERDEDSSLENTLRDLIPGVKVKVLKVTAPGKVDRDIISKVVEQIIEEEDEEQEDIELESTDTDDEVKDENDEEGDNIVLDADNGIPYGEEQSQIAVKVVVGGLVSKFSPGSQPKDLLRVPARLEKQGRLSFTFTVEDEDDNKCIAGGVGKTSPNKKAKLQGLRSVDHVMLDLAKFIGKGRIPMKVLKDVGELINLTLNQAQNHQPLSGSTTFSRIDIPGNQDPLNGLYIGAHGLYTSEVIHLRRKFGQWKEDARKEEPPNVEFYEYVEAVKLTGDPYVPAGQIAFRAKVGKRYQLPHKGIIPEEFGVVARYKGQGRLAEPGFRNPRWVDGELVILDGKYIKGGPVVGFVYWAPEFHFLVFFNRLRLHR